jgi:glutamate-1-semialdehyde 2,1-aminomutase
MAAGAAHLELLHEPGTYERLESLSAQLADGIAEAAHVAGVSIYQTRVGAMFTVFFTDGPVVDETSAKRADTTAYAAYFQAMLEQGVYLAPSQFEAGFMSLAHTQEDVAGTVEAAHAALKRMKSERRA